MVGFEARARMIQLETRSAQVGHKIEQLSDILIEPVTIVIGLNQKPIVLSQNKELVELLDKSVQLMESISSKSYYEQIGWRVIKKNSSDYHAIRSLFECIAVKVNASA